MDFRLSVCSVTVFSSRKCRHGLHNCGLCFVWTYQFCMSCLFFYKDVDLSMRSLFFSRAGAHMCDATQLMGEGGWGWWCSLHLHTCVMLRNWWVGVGGDDDVPCTHADHSDLFSLCGTQVAKMWHKRNQRVKFQRRCRHKQIQLKKGPTGGYLFFWKLACRWAKNTKKNKPPAGWNNLQNQYPQFMWKNTESHGMPRIQNEHTATFHFRPGGKFMILSQPTFSIWGITGSLIFPLTPICVEIYIYYIIYIYLYISTKRQNPKDPSARSLCSHHAKHKIIQHDEDWGCLIWSPSGIGWKNNGFQVIRLMGSMVLPIYIYIWSNYSDLTRPHPKWWFSKGMLLISGKSRLVKYYNLARYMHKVTRNVLA